MGKKVSLMLGQDVSKASDIPFKQKNRGNKFYNTRCVVSNVIAEIYTKLNELRAHGK